MTTQEWRRADRVAPAATPYERARLGFRNYWYPLCGSREVRSKPRRFMVLGEPIAAVRRDGKPFAMTEGCPHRGAPLSRGRHEFPGTNTITCRFHGWTYDLTDGRCVAALSDGPDSPVIGKVRLRMFPLEEHNGIVYIWMGSGPPVPLSDDVPRIPLRPGVTVKHRKSIVHGDWRDHAEFAGAGHFNVLHRDALAMRADRFFAYLPNPRVELSDEGDDGEFLLERNDPPVLQAEYPGLGVWPPRRLWRRNARSKRFRPVQGVRTLTAMRLPGVMRVRNFPQLGAIYYEWYVPRDEDHYTYFQISAHFPRNLAQRAWVVLWYHLWGRPLFKNRFNSQDVAMVEAVRRWTRSKGRGAPSPLFRPDVFPKAWIDYCNRFARGEGWEHRSQGDQGSPAP